MVIEGMLIRNVTGTADKAGQILCGGACRGLRMEGVHIKANASRCCAMQASGELPPGTCYWDTCEGAVAIPDFSGYNCSGSQCGGCRNKAVGSFSDCSPPPCLIPAEAQLQAAHTAVIATDGESGARWSGRLVPDGMVPVPTTPQLRYQNNEVVAILEFSGDLFFEGGMACSDFDPKAFKPPGAGGFDFDAWADVVEAITAKSAWISVKGFCGFLLWHTNTTLPDGRPYGWDAGALRPPPLPPGSVS